MNSVITKTTSSTHNDFEELSIQTLPLFLNKCKYTKAHAFTQSQLSLLNNIPIDILEHNLHININEAESKHAKLITSLNTLLNTSFTLSEIYQHYIVLTRTQYTVVNFVNCLIIIDAVLTRFSDFDSYSSANHNEDVSLFKLNINDIMLNNDLSFFQIENTNTHNVFNDVHKNSVFTNSVLDNIVTMIFSVNMGGILKCDDFTYDTFINNICLYNRVYFSHAGFAVFVHLCFVVYCNLYLLNSNTNNSNKVPSKAVDNSNNGVNKRVPLLNVPKLSRNNGNIYDNVYDTNIKSISLFKKRKSYNGTAITMRLPNTNNSTNNSNNNNKNNNISSMRNSNSKSLCLNEQCYLLDNDIISFPYTEIISALMFQSYLKLYLFAHVSSKKIKCTINLTIQNPITLLKSTLNPLLLTTSHLFSSLDPLFKDLSLSKTPLISKQSIHSAFKSISFKQLSFNFIAFNTLEQIHTKLNTYDVLFQKTTSLHIHEPIDITDTSNTASSKSSSSSSHVHDDNYMNIEMMFLQWKILNYFIDIINKNKDIKNSKKILSFVFKFNCFKFSLNKQTKDILLYFNYSFIKEKSLFVSFKKVQNVLMFINNLTDIISNVITSFKNYKIALRLFPNAFRSQQLLFYIGVILKYINNFIYESGNNNNNNKNIKIYDVINDNMSCFIKETNDIKKRKLTLMKFKNSFKHPHCNRFKFIFSYTNHIIEIFDYVVLCDKEDSFILLRTFDDNKIFFVIKPHNSLLDKHIPHTHLDNSNSYISVRIYVNNKKESYEHALNFIEMINNDKSIQEELNVTLICDKAFLETNVLIETKHKKVSKKFYQHIDDIYMISKSSSSSSHTNNSNYAQHDNNDYYNYDIFIADNFIAVSNFHKYNIVNDVKYKTLIYEFISILSSCIDLILHILKKKDIYIPRFIYIVHTHHNKYYSFEYKMSNIFIKKLTNFTSLFNFNTKKNLPLVCLLSKKQKSQYTISNDNFYDVFIRLFLNLHKVADMQTHLNEAFFHKIHKNIFLDYYDAFIPVCFSFDSFVHFNAFFACNNYTTLISKGDKFKQGYIIPIYTSLFETNEYNYNYVVNNNNNISLCRDVIVFMFGNMKDTVFGKNAASWLLSFNKVSFFIEKISKFYMRNERNQIMKSMYVLSKRINDKNILRNVFELTYKCNNYGMFDLTETTLNEIIKEFILEKERIKTQKVRLRVFQLTDKKNKYKNDNTNEINLNNTNHNNNCILF